MRFICWSTLLLLAPQGKVTSYFTAVSKPPPSFPDDATSQQASSGETTTATQQLSTPNTDALSDAE
jgi:hypothetical protein